MYHSFQQIPAAQPGEPGFTIAHQWPITGQARAILSRIQEGEVAVLRKKWIVNDYDAYRGLTDSADRKLTRLEALRREAINTVLGYTPEQVFQIDDTAFMAWHEFALEVPTVYEAVRDAFKARAERRSLAARVAA